MSIIDRYSTYLPATYSNSPQGRFVSLLVVRKVESEAIFRTEGSGEPLNREFVFAGRQYREGQQPMPRIVISKRKQTAVERRTGRELLRRFDLLKGKNERVCSLNTNTPCEWCVDCMLYGYAAGGGGSQRSRVITDDAFSLHSADTITGQRQFNALFDNSTMYTRDTGSDTGKRSTSIGTDEYVRPESLFIDIETLKDVTPDELRYVLGNLLRSARYGAISSRIGKVENILAGVVFSDCELFSNLELIQAVYDVLGDGKEPTFPLHQSQAERTVRAVTAVLLRDLPGRFVALSEEEVDELRREIVVLYADESALETMLRRMTASYGPRA